MTLLSNAQDQLKLYQGWYREARENVKFIKTLHDEIQNLDTWGMNTYGDVIEFNITFPKDNPELASNIKQLLVKLNNGKWLEREFNKYTGNHNLKGKCEISGKRLYFTLSDVNKPPNCEIIKKIKKEERIYYEARCNEEEEQGE